MSRRKNRPAKIATEPARSNRSRVLGVFALLATILAAWLLWPHVRAYRHWSLAEESLAARDFDRAAEHFEEYCLVYPQSDHAQFELARALRRAGRLDEASRALDRCDWIEDSLSLERMLISVQRGGTSGMRERLVRQIALPDPEKRLILEAMVVGDRKAMDLPSVQRWLTVWCDEFPDDPLAHLWRGDLLLAVKEVEQARRDYLKVVQLQPESGEALAKLGEATLAQNANFSAALPYFEQSLEVQPNHAVALLGVARCRHSLGDSAGAEQAAKQVLDSPAHRGEACLLLATLASDADRLEESLNWLQQAEKHGADPQRLHHQFALVLKRLGRPEEAARHDDAVRTIASATRQLETALAEVFEQPNNAEYHHKVGMIYLDLRQPEQAKGWFARALQQDSAFQPSREALARLHDADSAVGSP